MKHGYFVERDNRSVYLRLELPASPAGFLHGFQADGALNISEVEIGRGYCRQYLLRRSAPIVPPEYRKALDEAAKNAAEASHD